MRIRGRSGLVENDLELRTRGRELKHGLHEVLAELAVEPAGTDDQVPASAFQDSLFALQFCQTVNTGRCPFLVFAARRVVGISAEHVVGADVNQQAARFLHRGRQMADGGSVEQVRQLVIVFCGIHVGIGGAVDDGIDLPAAHHRTDGLRIRDVELLHFHAGHIVHVGEDILVGRCCGYDPQFASELSVGSSDKDVHGFARISCKANHFLPIRRLCLSVCGQGTRRSGRRACRPRYRNSGTSAGSGTRHRSPPVRPAHPGGRSGG